jgi:CheY-like chemotaxis protein
MGMSALAKGRGETILVVEGNLPIRKAIVESLELLNYRVTEAANGQEALAAREKYSDEITLVLSDMAMPGMSGVALLHALRAQELPARVVMLADHPVGKKMEGLQAQGMIDWLPKPPSLEQLAEVLARALDADW